MSDDLAKRLREDVFYGDERLHNLSRHNPLHMQAADRIEELEAKLAKATDTLARIVRGDDDAHNWAIWTLAELKREKK